MTAAIVAGGLGKRMGQATANLPKPMLPVGGKPILQHQLDWLRSQGFSDVTLCLGYKAEAVMAHFGGAVRYSVEKQPRGTAGCIKDLGAKGDVLVVYGDLFPELELKPLLDFHAKHDGAATLVLLETDHPEDSDLARLEGDRIVEIYRGGTGNLGLAAVWIVRPSLMKLVPADKPSDFGRDIFPKAIADGLGIYGCVMRGVLADLGTPERLARFEAGRA